jgi:hypothetical protein
VVLRNDTDMRFVSPSDCFGADILDAAENGIRYPCAEGGLFLPSIFFGADILDATDVRYCPRELVMAPFFCCR